MYFDLTDEQKAIRDSVRSFLGDKLDARRTVALFDAQSLDRELFTSLMGLGLGGVLVPTLHEGLGLDLLTLSVVAEVLGYYGVPAPVAQNALASWLVAAMGNTTQRDRWLNRLTSGKAIAAFALFEENCGWLPSDWTLEGPRLTGAKHYVEWGIAADVFIVGLRGGGLALIESTAAGVEIAPLEALDRSRPMATVKFTDVPILAWSQIDVTHKLIDALLVLLAADACGAGTRAYEMAVEYAQVRTQFGQVIGKFQALKHQLANMAVDMEPCRALYWYAAHAWDALPDKCERAAANAKAHISDLAVRTARAAVEAHGGIGYTWEYPLHIYLKRAMHSRSAMGMPSEHRARMAALAGW